MNFQSGKLFVVATPIGNLEDITLRALRVLREVDFVLAESPQHTKILFQKYQIKTPLFVYNQHTSEEKIKSIILKIKKGQNVALVSSAGTPGILDPGIRLIQAALNNKIEVIAIPGPSALVAAASISGINMARFLFLGFLPNKKGRKKILNYCKQIPYPVILYESPYRILKTLKQIQDILGDLNVVVLREITKKFEERIEGKISQIISKIKPKGEFVIIISQKENEK